MAEVESRLATRILLIGGQEGHATLADQGEGVVLVPDGLNGLNLLEICGTGFEETDRGSSRTIRARTAMSSNVEDFDDTID